MMDAKELIEKMLGLAKAESSQYWQASYEAKTDHEKRGYEEAAVRKSELAAQIRVLAFKASGGEVDLEPGRIVIEEKGDTQ